MIKQKRNKFQDSETLRMLSSLSRREKNIQNIEASTRTTVRFHFLLECSKTHKTTLKWNVYTVAQQLQQRQNNKKEKTSKQ